MTQETTKQPEPVKWVTLVNETGNIAEVPARDVALWEKDGWKVVKE